MQMFGVSLRDAFMWQEIRRTKVVDLIQAGHRRRGWMMLKVEEREYQNEKGKTAWKQIEDAFVQEWTDNG